MITSRLWARTVLCSCFYTRFQRGYFSKTLFSYYMVDSGHGTVRFSVHATRPPFQKIGQTPIATVIITQYSMKSECFFTLYTPTAQVAPTIRRTRAPMKTQRPTSKCRGFPRASYCAIDLQDKTKMIDLQDETKMIDPQEKTRMIDPQDDWGKTFVVARQKELISFLRKLMGDGKTHLTAYLCCHFRFFRPHSEDIPIHGRPFEEHAAYRPGK